MLNHSRRDMSLLVVSCPSNRGQHRQSFLLHVNGAGHGHGATILGNDGQVGRAVVLRDKVLGLVVLVGVGGVVRDPAADVVGKVVRGHVVDELLGEQKVGERGEGGRRVRTEKELQLHR